MVGRACLVAALALLAGCTALRPGPVTDPGALASLRPEDERPTANWPMDPESAHDALRRGHIEFLSMERTTGGATGASKVEARIDGQPVTLKWRAAPRGTADSFNNSPRKELAAFAVQQLVLPPERWVIPPVALRCIPREQLAALGHRQPPTLTRSRCVLGTVSLWLDDVGVATPSWDPDRFWTDPTYAVSVGDLNVLTWLILHQDGKADNLLQGTETGLLFSVDNGISFGGPFYNWGADNWDHIRVPAVPADTVRRVRAITPEQLASLTRVAAVERTPEGVLRPTDGPADLVLGLDAWEWRRVWARAQRLVRWVEQGRLPTF